MADEVVLWEKPKAEIIFMFVGWRQWADAGSVSSGLVKYLAEQAGARLIGQIRADGFYLFQFPGTHDLVRPVIKFEEGFPKSLKTPITELFYSGDARQGIVYLLGDEPHLDIDRYAAAILQLAKSLEIKRIVGFGGVYGELPYDKERMVQGIYSLPEMKEEMNGLAISLSDYHGGASIESVICKRASEQGIEFVSFYAFVPTYDLSNLTQQLENPLTNSIRIENDFTAWLAVMRRVNYMLKLHLNLSDLEKKSRHLQKLMDSKVEELEKAAPQLGLKEYLRRLSEGYTETPFVPLDDIWEEELKRLLDKFDDEDQSQEPGNTNPETS